MKKATFNMSKVKRAMARNTRFCKENDLHCRSVFYVDDFGDTEEITMFSKIFDDIDIWWNVKIKELDEMGVFYNTLTV